MSRGGFAGRGRGGYSGPPGSRLNHGTMPFEISEELLAHEELLKKESGLFPKMDVPQPKPLSKAELVTVEAYRELRTKRQLGPYYFPSTAGDTNRRAKRQRVDKQNSRTTYNAFEDQKTYLAVQEEARRAFKEAQYAKLPFPKDVLPKELWGICGLASGPQYWPNVRGDKKSLLSMKQKLARIDDDAEDAEDEEPVADDDDKSRASDDEDKEKDSNASDRDDDFSDAEDSMAGDYNAEQYFDDGDGENDDLGRGDEGGAYE